MSIDLTVSTVCILRRDGSTAGTGFVVSGEGLIATCAHVVEAAGVGPGGTVRIIFHSICQEATANVESEGWRPPDAGDTAFLQLSDPLPQGVIPALLGASAGRSGTQVQAFGYPDLGEVEGLWGKGELIGPVTEAKRPLLQLRSSEITAGFSGGPVRDVATGYVIGMVTQIAKPDRYGKLGEVAFAIPAETLRAVCPKLAISPIEPSTLYPLLQDFMYDFSDTIERATLRFVGRGFVFRALEAFIQQHPCGYFRIVADAGLGKTAIAAEIARRYGAMVHAFNVSAGLTRPDQCLNHLSACLITRYGLPHDRLPPRAGEDSAFLQQYLKEAAERREGKPLLLVIDALDEADPPLPGRNWLYLPEGLPEGVYLVLTHRPGDYPMTTSARTPVEELTITWDDPHQQADIEGHLWRQVERPEISRALEKATPSIPVGRFVNALKEASEGNFMYVTYLLADIVARELGFDPLRLEALPRGLVGYYGQFWARMEQVRGEEGWAEWQGLYRPVIELLGVALEPVTAGWLAAHSQREPNEVLERALLRWQRFLRREQRDGGETWCLVHRSFADFLTEKVELSAAHQRIAAYCWGVPARWEEHNAYALRHLGRHLAAAGDAERLRYLVMSKDWWKAQLKYDRSGLAYAHDVELALEPIDASIRRALRECRASGQSVSNEDMLSQMPPLVALTLATAMVHAKGNNAPLEAIVGLAVLGEVDLALKYASLVQDTGDCSRTAILEREILGRGSDLLGHSRQAEAYRRIALVCLEEAETSRSKGNQHRSLVRLNQARLALSSAVRILEDDEERHPGLDLLLPAMIRAAMGTETDRLASQYGVNLPEADVLREEETSSLWTSGDGISVSKFRSLCRQIEEAVTKGQEDAELVGWEAVQAVRDLSNGGGLGGDVEKEMFLLGAHIADLKSSSLSLALVDAVEALNYDYADQKARTLAAVTESQSLVLPREIARELLEESWRIASEHARKDFGATGQARVAVAMHRVGMMYRAKCLLREVIGTIRDIHPVWDREMATEALAWAATQNKDRENLDLVLAVADELQQGRWKGKQIILRIIESLASAGALSTAWEILDKTWPDEELERTWRSRAIGTIISNLKHAGSTAEGLEILNRLSDNETRTLAMCVLADAASARSRRDRAELVLLQAIDDYLAPEIRNSGGGLGILIRRLAESAATAGSDDVLARLGQLCLRIKGHDARDRALASLVQGMVSDGCQWHTMALSFARRIRRKRDRARMLITIAREAHESMGDARIARALGEVARLIRKVKDPADKAQICLELATLLVEYGHAANLEEMLKCALDYGQLTVRKGHQPRRFLPNGMGTGNSIPDSQAEFVSRCLDLLKETRASNLLDKAMKIVQDETNPYDRACFSTRMACALRAAGKAQVADDLMGGTRQWLRDYVPSQREGAPTKYLGGTIGEDALCVVQVARALAVVHDRHGLRSLAQLARYFDDPEERKYNPKGALIKQAEVLGVIAGHLIDIGSSDEAVVLVGEMGTDEEWSEAVSSVVSTLLRSPYPELVGWVRTVANQVQEDVYREYTQRKLCQLLAFYGRQVEAWQAAKQAMDSALQALSGGREINLFRCLENMVDGLEPLINHGSCQSVEFLVYSLGKVRRSGKHDAWAMIGALYPLLAKVGGRAVAEETWRQIELVENLWYASSAIAANGVE